MELGEEYWTHKYRDNFLGWDIGYISTPLKAYFDQLENKDIKILIPGGGNSYEAEYLFLKGFREVYVADISLVPLRNLQNRVPGFPGDYLLHTDFFKLKGQFDLIIEQTFFCALDPRKRPDYARHIAELLKPEGKLVGVLFDTELNRDRPPFGGNKGEYQVYFKPYFQFRYFERCYNSIPPRSGVELFINLVKLIDKD